MQSNWIKQSVVFGLLALLLVIYYTAFSGGGFPLDDSWIHQTFARNLSETGEWAFLRGQPTAASTSPLYTLLLSVGYTLNVPYTLWTHGLGVVALAGAAILAARLSAMIAPDVRFADWAGGLAILFTWHHVWAASAGMETMLFGMLTLGVIYGLWHEITTKETQIQSVVIRGAIWGAIVALATLARPEGVLLGGISALMLVFAIFPDVRRILIYGVATLIAFVIVMSPYLLLNLELTGGLLPDTAAAKFEQHAILLQRPLVARVLDLFTAIFAGGQVLLIPGIVAYGVLIWRKGRAGWGYAVPIVWGVALVLLYAVRLPAAYQHGRYVIPALPALVMAGAIGTLILISAATRQRQTAMIRRVLVRVYVLTLVLMSAIFTLIIGSGAYALDTAIINQEMVESAQWIADNIPQDELLAIHDIGAVGYFTDRPDLLDIAGLISPEVIPIVADDAALWVLMEERGAAYLMAFPDQIPGGTPDDPRLCPVYVSDGAATITAGGEPMAIYRLAWDGQCA